MAKRRGLAIVELSRLGMPQGREYADEGFVVTGTGWDGIDAFRTPVRPGGFCFVLCERGHCRVSLNLTDSPIGEGMLFFVVPGTVVHLDEVSADLRLRMVGFTADFVRDVRTVIHVIYPFIFQSPLLCASPEDARRIAELFDLMYAKAQRHGHPFRGEMLRNLLNVLFCEIGALYRSDAVSPDHVLSRNEEIFRQLMRLIMLHYKKERTVAFYAHALCLTPKYLSSVVKRISHKTLSEWIADTIILDAKTQLKSSQMTIQQLSNYLNFPNPSFFGRFFKKHTGMTPKEYRLSE